MNASSIHLDLSHDIAVLTIDQPGRKVNTLSLSCLQEFQDAIDVVANAPQIRGLFIASGKPGHFLAGADLHELYAARKYAEPSIQSIIARGHALLAALERLPCPTVALIDGSCLGGGLELALACDARIVGTHSKVILGLPEVKLGLIPGWGGTQRLPRLIGVVPALEMLTTGNTLNSKESLQRGLIDAIVQSEHLFDEARQWLQPRTDRTAAIIDFSPGDIETFRNKMLQEKRRPSPAALVAVDVVARGVIRPLTEAIPIETAAFQDLFSNPAPGHLINTFLSEQRVMKETGVDDPSVSPRELQRVQVIGAGLMGCGIAGAFVASGLSVAIDDSSQPARQVARTRIEQTLVRRKLTPEAVEAAMTQFHLGSIEVPDLVIEAIVENEGIKRDVLQQIESRIPANSILVSNTSTISITTMAAVLHHRERFAGMHFFNPVERMRLVEVIRGRETSDEVVASIVAWAKRLGKIPIVSRDGPGFIVNRVLFPYLCGAMHLLDEGKSIAAIDDAALSFGMPMGPIRLCDVIGLDVTLHAAQILAQAFPSRFYVSPTLSRLVAEGKLGQKSGGGFYSLHATSTNECLSVQAITERLFLPMYCEATRVVADGIARSANDVDLALILGCGFPGERGGIFGWAADLGPEQLYEMLQRHAARGDAFIPAT